MDKLSSDKRKIRADIAVIGFALFAMYFGAGNLIFPPDLGVRTGPYWFISFICYFITDMGLGIVAIISAMRFDADISALTAPIGRIPSILVCTANIICLGPALAIPRTAATTFELGLVPISSIKLGDKVALAVFSVIFFLIVFFLTIRPSKVVDIIGKILTPVLLISLLILIVKGVISPQGEIGEAISEDIIKDGFYNGYQTLDLMGSMFFAVIILNSALDKGYRGKKECFIVTAKSAMLSGVMLFIVYSGLCYLGATTGTQWADEVASGNMNQAGLLINITASLLGKPGTFVLVTVVAFACLTTAVGLTSAASEYFFNASKGKIKQEWAITAICVISALVCNLGLSKIISFSAPVLLLLYPLTVLLVITAYFRGKVKNRMPYILSSIVTFVISLFESLGTNFGFDGLLRFVESLPLYDYGFCWLLPATAFFLIGLLVPGPKIAESKACEPV